MTQRYIKEFDKLPSTGPLTLIGHSYGGWIVFEIACCLERLGRSIGHVILLDSDSPSFLTEQIREYNNLEIMLSWVEAFDLVLDRPLGITEANLAGLNQTERINLIHAKLKSRSIMPRQSISSIMIGPYRTYAAALRAHYLPSSSYSGHVCLILAKADSDHVQHDVGRYAKLIGRWKHWAANLTYIETSGNHATLLKQPHVNELSRLLATLMEWM
jgi:thioesterase domain-containing protein